MSIAKQSRSVVCRIVQYLFKEKKSFAAAKTTKHLALVTLYCTLAGQRFLSLSSDGRNVDRCLSGPGKKKGRRPGMIINLVVQHTPYACRKSVSRTLIYPSILCLSLPYACMPPVVSNYVWSFLFQKYYNQGTYHIYYYLQKEKKRKKISQGTMWYSQTRDRDAPYI